MTKRRASSGAGESKPEAEVQPVPSERAQPSEDEAGDAVLQSRIAARAYALFLARGGRHGDDWADWLQAEREVLAEEGRTPDPEGA